MNNISDQELRDLVKKNSLQIEKLSESQAKTDALIQEFKAENAKGFQELREAQAKTDKKLNRVSTIFGNLGIIEGELAEQRIYNGLSDNLSIGGMKFDQINRNIRPDGDQGPEFDIVLYNGDSICIVEVKKKMHVKDMAKILNNQIADFRKYFPQYMTYKIYFAIGSLIIYKELIDKSCEMGVFLLSEKNDIIEVLNGKAIAY